MEKNESYVISGMYTYYYHNGRYADWGHFELEAAKLAIEDINASGLLDKPLEMPETLIEDYHCWPDNAAEITENIFKKHDNILALTGVDCSGPAVHMSNVAKKWKIPAVSCGSNTSELSSIEEFPYFVRVVTPSDIFDGYLLVLAKYLDINEIVFCHTTDSWGLGARDVILEFAEKYNIKLVETLAYARDTSVDDMLVHVKKFKEKGYKNYLIIAPTPDTVTVFKAFYHLDMNVEGMRIFAGEMVSADEKEDVVFGSYGYIAPMTSFPKSTMLDTFVEKFEKAIEKKVDIDSKAFAFASLSYDHIWLVAHGIRYLIDNKMEINGENLNVAMRKVDFQGLSGRIAVVENTNDRAYMGMSFLNNQGYNADGSVNFVAVGSLDTETEEIVFHHDRMRWPGTREK